PGAAPGSCVCPPGTVLEGRQCTPLAQSCPSPMVPGACTCPEGSVQQGRFCITATPVDVKIEKTGGTTPACDVPAYIFNTLVPNGGKGWPGTGNITVTDTVPVGMTATVGGPGWTCPTGTLSGGTTFTCTYNGPAPTANQVLPGISITATAITG